MTAGHPNHHPDEETLARFSAGGLRSGRSLVIAAHLPFCPECRATVRLHEAIGGILLSDEPETPLSDGALNRALARLDEPSRMIEPIADNAWLAPGVPMPPVLRGMVRSPWRWLAPGIRRIALDTGTAEDVYLLRVDGGAGLPEHGHRGLETTCVLAGGFTDATGSYGPGDVVELAEDVEHAPVADHGEACVCLIVADGRARMTSWLARLVAAAMRI
jgi:putative transcriptional regulator